LGAHGAAAKKSGIVEVKLVAGWEVPSDERLGREGGGERGRGERGEGEGRGERGEGRGGERGGRAGSGAIPDNIKSSPASGKQGC
jgi:hypothetical protein